jgi:hypothetical protein
MVRSAVGADAASPARDSDVANEIRHKARLAVVKVPVRMHP